MNQMYLVISQAKFMPLADELTHALNSLISFCTLVTVHVHVLLNTDHSLSEVTCLFFYLKLLRCSLHHESRRKPILNLSGKIPGSTKAEYK